MEFKRVDMVVVVVLGGEGRVRVRTSLDFPYKPGSSQEFGEQGERKVLLRGG